ncbi:MAG: VanZ family protein [bacterium]|nr:VanZ family protein [bacterium]
MLSFFTKYYQAILWSFISLFACGVNGNSFPHVSFDIGIDKIAHFVLFGMQSFLIAFAYHQDKKNTNWNNIHLSVLIGILYGVLIEFLQYAIFINRSFDYADMLADALGACSIYLWAFFRGKFK